MITNVFFHQGQYHFSGKWNLTKKKKAVRNIFLAYVYSVQSFRRRPARRKRVHKNPACLKLSSLCPPLVATHSLFHTKFVHTTVFGDGHRKILGGEEGWVMLSRFRFSHCNMKHWTFKTPNPKVFFSPTSATEPGRHKSKKIIEIMCHFSTSSETCETVHIHHSIFNIDTTKESEK